MRGSSQRGWRRSRAQYWGGGGGQRIPRFARNDKGLFTGVLLARLEWLRKTSASDATGAKARESFLLIDAALKRRSSMSLPEFCGAALSPPGRRGWRPIADSSLREE